MTSSSKAGLHGFPPGGYLVGAQKSGTTSLAEAIAVHPLIEIADPKEPHYFTNNLERGESWYRARFEDLDNRVLVDASTSYTMAPLNPAAKSRLQGVARRIREARPDARILYIVRDPVERAISAYWHAVRYGDETRELEQCLGDDSIYVRGSLYAFQLQQYFNLFPRDQIRVMTTRELAVNLEGVVRGCWKFLGLDDFDTVPFASTEQRNRGYVMTGLAGKMLKLPGGKRSAKLAWGFLKKTLPSSALEQVRSRVTERPPTISPHTRKALEERLSNESDLLSELIGRRLDEW